MGARMGRLMQVVLICVLLLIQLVPAWSSGPLTIAVVLSREAAPYRQALKGFEEVLKGSGRLYKLQEFVLDGASTPDTVVGRLRSRKPDLIVTLGSSATDLVGENIRSVPVVFSMVLPSSGSGSLEVRRTTRDNVTGAMMEIPLKTQFLKIKEVLPEARRIGVLFNPSITGPLIETAGLTASALGFELVAIPVATEKDIVSSIESLAGKVDVLWSVADSTVFSPSGLRQILLVTLRNRIPFIGLSPSFVKAGALLALTVDYQDVGRQSGEQALRILTGEQPAQVPLSIPRNVSLSLNMNTARLINVEIADQVRLQAELYF